MPLSSKPLLSNELALQMGLALEPGQDPGPLSLTDPATQQAIDTIALQRLAPETLEELKEKFGLMLSEQAEALREEVARLKREHEELKRLYDDLRFENEGRKLAWKIHGVDKLLSSSSLPEAMCTTTRLNLLAL